MTWAVKNSNRSFFSQPHLAFLFWAWSRALSHQFNRRGVFSSLFKSLFSLGIDAKAIYFGLFWSCHSLKTSGRSVSNPHVQVGFFNICKESRSEFNTPHCTFFIASRELGEKVSSLIIIKHRVGNIGHHFPNIFANFKPRTRSSGFILILLLDF